MLGIEIIGSITSVSNTYLIMKPKTSFPTERKSGSEKKIIKIRQGMHSHKGEDTHKYAGNDHVHVKIINILIPA